MNPAVSHVIPQPSSELLHLEQKLLRELAQSEYDAYLHTQRQAARLGDCTPAEVCLEISGHAESTRPRLHALMEARDRRVGHALASFVGRIFSNLRHYGLDNVIANERSYRATLLGLRHGVEAARLLRFVSLRCGSDDVTVFCSELLSVREAQLDRAVAALEWFADHPELAAH
jgi:hypothetical protein